LGDEKSVDELSVDEISSHRSEAPAIKLFTAAINSGNKRGMKLITVVILYLLDVFGSAEMKLFEA
jgi:hypothetical protein